MSALRLGIIAALTLFSGCFTMKLSPDSAVPPKRPVLAYQLDISRNKVPTMASLRRMVELLARLGYDELQLYTEHTFAYAAHPTVWREASPMTPDEVRELDDFCAAKGILLVPNQNSFGHLEEWLRHPEYNSLAERPQAGGRYRRWGDYVVRTPRSLCPTDERVKGFLDSLYAELFPCFRPGPVNIGFDEVLELEDDDGGGRSAAAIAAVGAPQVYLGFLNEVASLCRARGRTVMFWGDAVLRNREFLKALPADAVCLDWGYEADHPFDAEAASLQAAGCRFRTCPGTSAWGSLSGRTDNMMTNIDAAVTAAGRYGAEGVLLADWGDGGHPNPWLVSVPAIVYAAHRFRGERLTRERLAAEIDELLGGRIGAALCRAGDVYRAARGRMGNSTELYHLLEDGADYRRAPDVTDETVAAALAVWHEADRLAELEGADEWVRDDWEMLRLLYRAVELKAADPTRRNFRAMFESDYRRLWLKSNRPGGLERSLDRVFGPFRP